MTLGPSGQRVSSAVRVDEAVARRARLVQEAEVLRGLEYRTQAQERQLKVLDRDIRDYSEALGEAAGLRYAQTLPGGLAGVRVDRGSGAADLLHIGPDPDRVVTVIECKGGTSELGSRHRAAASRG